MCPSGRVGRHASKLAHGRRHASLWCTHELVRESSIEIALNGSPRAQAWVPQSAMPASASSSTLRALNGTLAKRLGARLGQRCLPASLQPPRGVRCRPTGDRHTRTPRTCSWRLAAPSRAQPGGVAPRVAAPVPNDSRRSRERSERASERVAAAGLAVPRPPCVYGPAGDSSLLLCAKEQPAVCEAATQHRVEAVTAVEGRPATLASVSTSWSAPRRGGEALRSGAGWGNAGRMSPRCMSWGRVPRRAEPTGLGGGGRHPPPPSGGDAPHRAPARSASRRHGRHAFASMSGGRARSLSLNEKTDRGRRSAVRRVVRGRGGVEAVPSFRSVDP
eukprot:365004-Chlamydomonas_euryale.AAC.8